jgi:hypothetical protein
MQYQKLDPGLITALDGSGSDDRFTIFLHTNPVSDSTAEQAFSRLCAPPVSVGNNLYTATLSRDDVAALSEVDWVKYLRLSQQLRPAKDPGG